MHHLAFHKEKLSLRWERVIHAHSRVYAPVSERAYVMSSSALQEEEEILKNFDNESTAMKIALTKAFTFKIGCERLSLKEIEDIRKELDQSCVHDLTLSVSLHGCKHEVYMIEDPKHADDFERVRAKHRSTVKGFESLKNDFLSSLDSSGIASGSIELHLKNKLEYPHSWFITETRLISAEYIELSFKRDSQMFRLFDERGWIRKYRPWK